MKRIRISFLFVLAVMAIGLTAATKADLFKDKKQAYTCREDIDFIKGDFKLPTSSTVYNDYYNDGILTPENGTATACPGEDTYCAKDLTVTTKDFECTEGEDEFCCAELLSPTSPCGTDPAPVGGADDNRLFTTKVKIWCKSSESLPPSQEYPQ